MTPQQQERKRAKQLAYNKNWIAKVTATPEGREWYKAYRRAHSYPNPELSLRWRLNVKYKMSPEDRDRLLAMQNHKCATCPNDLLPGRRDVHIDHCHKTGKVRGILCRGCNTALGLVKENPKTLRALAHYVANPVDVLALIH